MNVGVDDLNELFTKLDSWVNSALEDLNDYDISHVNPIFSKRKCIEFIQRALEKGVKISSFFFELLIDLSPSNSLDDYLDLLKSKEISESLNIEFLQRFNKLLYSVDKLKTPKGMGHVPCTLLIKEASKLIPSEEYLQESQEIERKVIDALIEIKVLAESDVEVYRSYSNSLRLFEIELLKSTSYDSSSFDQVISKVAKLKEKMPKDEFSLIVYLYVSMRLFHTFLGRLMLFTPMKAFSESLNEVDALAFKIHNDLVKSGKDSEFFKNFNRFLRSLFIISSFFPLCQYLGKFYEYLKYPVNSGNFEEMGKEEKIVELINYDSYFSGVSADLRNALNEFQLSSKFYKIYIFGEDGQL